MNGFYVVFISLYLLAVMEVLELARVFDRAEFQSPAPDWEICVPDGYGATASITYKGQELRVNGLTLEVYANSWATLTLYVHPFNAQALLSDLSGVDVVVLDKSREGESDSSI